MKAAFRKDIGPRADKEDAVSDRILYEVRGASAFIAINRPEHRNALDAGTIEDFHGVLDAAGTDERVRVLVVSGAGDKAFCTGAQLQAEMGGSGASVFGRFASLLFRIATFPKPTVARVKGYCLAGGMGVMLACDVVIASDDAVFGTPEVNVGLWPMMIGALIFRNVPRKKAMDMILSGRRILAQEALAMGLVSRVVPPETLDTQVDALAEELASKSPIGIRIGKEAFHASEGMGLEEALMFLSTKIAEVASTEDAREGILAFMEKRTPVFTGR